MKLENNIGWCDATTNAVTGCTEVSPGCSRCYAKVGTRARVLRAGNPKKGIAPVETWGPKGQRVPVNFEPVFRRLNKLCVCDKCHTAFPVEHLKWAQSVCQEYSFSTGACGGKLRRIRLFADSNSDWLDPKWPVETLARFLDAIRQAPNVDTILLTKRIELFNDRLRAAELWASHNAPQSKEASAFISRWRHANDEPSNGDDIAPKHVWLLVSVEDQKRADERIPLLLQTPAAVRGLSVEPLLERVDLASAALKHYLNESSTCCLNGISWVIVGAESGKKRRDCGVEAIESVVLQCANAGVPVYCKQDCAFQSGQKGRISDNAWSFKEFPR